ncbi:hypothetical protein D9M72_474170 [compost metagenome]
MRCIRIELAEHAHDLLKFGHQLRLVLQAAGGVDDQHVGLLLARLLERFIGETGGIGAELGGNDVGLGALRPDLQLLDRRGTEGVAGGKHDLEACARKLGGELADRRGLAGTVDADHQNDMRLVAEVELQRLGDGRKHLGDLAGHDARDVLAGDILAIALGGERIGDAHRGFDAEIGLDQQILEILERRFVELAFGEEAGDLAGQLRRGAGKAAAQALVPGELFLRRGEGLVLGLVVGGCEALGKGRGCGSYIRFVSLDL